MEVLPTEERRMKLDKKHFCLSDPTCCSEKLREIFVEKDGMVVLESIFWGRPEKVTTQQVEEAA